MDPNETLSRLRVLVEECNRQRSLAAEAEDREQYSKAVDHHQEADDLAREAVDYCDSLISWIDKGGFLPQDWEKKA